MSMARRAARRLLDPRPPRRISDRFRQTSPAAAEAIQGALEKHFFARSPPGYLETQCGREDLLNHLVRRLDNDRRVVIPWLDAVRRLSGAAILEIGCGTGSSTVALAEQGAHVAAVDLDEPALRVAQTRCQAYELDVEFHLAGAAEAPRLLAGRHFDFVVFYASLEHMVHQERLAAIRETWDLLPPGGLWCVVETPNRLWYFDGHTALLPFFHWLPDDLAFEYARFSPRESLRERCRQHDGDGLLRFLRSGRGVSYHEFEVALERPARQLNVVSSLSSHRRLLELLRRLRWPRPLETQYASLLRRIHPQIHRGFLQPNLDLVLQKPPRNDECRTSNVE
jgi:S-adenosylmethionine-dependent methyltransferase